MWITFRRRIINTGNEVIGLHVVPRCSFLASEQISGNRFSTTGPWTAGTGYLRWLLMQTLCRHSKQDTTDSSKIWKIKAHQLLIPSSTSTSTSTAEDFLQAVHCTVYRSPCVILYTKQQIKNGCVLYFECVI